MRGSPQAIEFYKKAFGPLAVGGSPVFMHLYVENVDAAVERAIAASATLLRRVKDEFYGDRTRGFRVTAASTRF